MNIFFIDKDPEIAAKAMADKHIVKMILETAQILCTAHRVIDGTPYTHTSAKGRKIKRYKHPSHDNVLYQSAYYNHPCNVWVRQSVDNYNWTYRHFANLCYQYRQRFNRVHKAEKQLLMVLFYPPVNLQYGPLTPPAQAMPDQYRNSDPIVAYRTYYEAEKFFTPKDKQNYNEVLYSKDIL